MRLQASSAEITGEQVFADEEEDQQGGQEAGHMGGMVYATNIFLLGLEEGEQRGDEFLPEEKDEQDERR